MLEIKVLSVIIVILLINCAIILTNLSGGAVQTRQTAKCIVARLSWCHATLSYHYNSVKEDGIRYQKQWQLCAYI